MLKCIHQTSHHTHSVLGSSTDPKCLGSIHLCDHGCQIAWWTDWMQEFIRGCDARFNINILSRQEVKAFPKVGRCTENGGHTTTSSQQDHYTFQLLIILKSVSIVSLQHQRVAVALRGLRERETSSKHPFLLAWSPAINSQSNQGLLCVHGPCPAVFYTQV